MTTTTAAARRIKTRRNVSGIGFPTLSAANFIANRNRPLHIEAVITCGVYFRAMQTVASQAAVNRPVDAKRALALAREVLATEAHAITSLDNRRACSRRRACVSASRCARVLNGG